MERRLRGIECVMADGQRVLLPVDAVDQIIEYDVAPLPLARPFVRGLGLHDGVLLVSLSLIDDGAHQRNRRCLGALLASAGSSTLRWAVELPHAVSLTNVIGIARIDEEPPLRPTGAGHWPSWLTRAVAEDGGRVLWLDVPRVLRDFSAV